jgi:ABC-type multidrug transport system fused ATPase/permease subunit
MKTNIFVVLLVLCYIRANAGLLPASPARYMFRNRVFRGTGRFAGTKTTSNTSSPTQAVPASATKNSAALSLELTNAHLSETVPAGAGLAALAATNNSIDKRNKTAELLSHMIPKGPDGWKMKMLIIVSLGFLYLSKWVGIQLPFLLQSAVDLMPKLSAAAGTNAFGEIATKIGYTIGLYGLARATSALFSELKTNIFNTVSQSLLKDFAATIFAKLHELGSDFHLTTPGGTISVAYIRAIRGFQIIMFQTIFSAVPALLELIMVSYVLYNRFGPQFAGITITTFTLYLVYTVLITQWRVRIRQDMVSVENARNGFLIDSLLNHETVKLFTNEEHENKRFDKYLHDIKKHNLRASRAIGLLNSGQAVIFTAGLVVSLLFAFAKFKQGLLSVGDVVALNALLLQLSVPFNFMGFTCKFTILKYRVLFFYRVVPFVDQIKS